MAAVLYEPAFVVLTALFGAQSRRAITALTLIAGFASALAIPGILELLAVLPWRQDPGTADLRQSESVRAFIRRRQRRLNHSARRRAIRLAGPRASRPHHGRAGSTHAGGERAGAAGDGRHWVGDG